MCVTSPTIHLRGYNSSITKHIEINKTIHQPFLIQMNEKEVLTTTQQKKMRKLLKIATQTCVSFFALSVPTMATENTIVTPEIVNIFTQLELGAVTLGVSLAIITLTLAGIQRMLRQRKKSLDWTIDIIKGLAQVLVAPILVMSLVHLVYFLFAGSSWFVSPLQVK